MASVVLSLFLSSVVSTFYSYFDLFSSSILFNYSLYFLRCNLEIIRFKSLKSPANFSSIKVFFGTTEDASAVMSPTAFSS
jgi:hypothetical protein